MKPDDILSALQDLTNRERIEFLPLAVDTRKASPYAPIEKYLLDLQHKAKPESAAEDLFTALCKDLLGFQPTRQVGVMEGFVDFMLPEPMGQPLPLELKPLFQRDGPDALWRGDANPKHHVTQVKKYLRDHEYLILTDLRTAWFFSARDFFFDNKHFAVLPFVDFVNRCRETRSVLDAVRRVEDAAEKPELERQFFEDLKHWFDEFDKVQWTPPDLAAESIILLINKLIFARTIEDFGLVPYRYTQDAYAQHTRDWQAKGPHRIVPKFLAQFEEFFDEYYDTEIFSARVWERLDKDPANLKRFCDKLNFVLGVNAWDQAFSRGIVHYNYRRIDEDIFGKSYEMFLAANRKDEGIYYTPAGITGPMADSLVNSLAGKIVDEIGEAAGSQKCDFKRADALMAQLAEIRVADTACGSGGFLIKVLRAFWRQYQRIDSASGWVGKILKPANGELYLAELPPNVEAALAFRRRHQFDNRRVLIAQILLRHIFGLDKDPGALEVAKTNIWKEAVKLSPEDYNYRLLKTDVVRILPNLELNFLAADSLVDVELEKQVAWLAEYHQAELKKLSELRRRYTDNPMDHAPLDEALELRKKVRADFVEHFQGENLPCEPGGFALHFWPCWFDADGKPGVGPASRLSPSSKEPEKSETGATPVRRTAGFDGIIGNPPWEAVKPVRKEFAKVGKYSMSVPDFDEWFTTKLREDKRFQERWTQYSEHYTTYKDYLSRRFLNQGTGDWNYFKLFIEQDVGLVRTAGRLSLLVPSGFYTDEGCRELRRLLILENKLDTLTSFENRGYTEVVDGKERTKHIFPDVDNRFKFGFFKVTKGSPPIADYTFESLFYLRDPAQIADQTLKYSVEMMKRFSPENLSILEFRSQDDYLLCMKIRNQHALLQELGYTFRRELHSSDDSALFHKRGTAPLKKGQLLRFDGKMIFQFQHSFKPAEFVVEEAAAREMLLQKECYRIGRIIRESEASELDGEAVPRSKAEFDRWLARLFERKGFKLEYELPRLVYRQVGSATNERTLIAALVPDRVCLVDTLMFLAPYRYEIRIQNLEQVFLDEAVASYLLALMNSLTLNYFLRNRVSTHVNIFHVYELPLPNLTSTQRDILVKAATKLVRQPVNVKERAALEVFIARELYGLSLDDWKHLTGTFTFGSGDTKAELDEIIRQSLALWGN